MDFLPIWAFWLGLALLLFAGEILTTGFFLFPFGVGAAAAALADMLGVSLLWQWAVLLAGSAICVVFSGRLARVFDRSPGLRAGADRLIGMDGLVIETIDPERNAGTVRADKESWRAQPAEHATILKGTRVTVLGIKGAHMIVSPKQG